MCYAYRKYDVSNVATTERQRRFDVPHNYAQFAWSTARHHVHVCNPFDILNTKRQSGGFNKQILYAYVYSKRTRVQVPIMLADMSDVVLCVGCLTCCAGRCVRDRCVRAAGTSNYVYTKLGWRCCVRAKTQFSHVGML